MSEILQNKFGAGLIEDTVNVIENYNWFQKRSLRTDELANIPRIHLTEYQMSCNGLYSTIKFYATAFKNSNFKGGRINPYENLYSAKPTGKKFVFPYFSEELDNHSSSWQVAKDLADAGGLEGVFGEIAKLGNDLKAAYRAYRAIARPDKVSSYKVSPYIWKSTMGMRPTINFSLFNTPISPEDNIEETYTKNKNLVDYLRLASTFDQVGPIEATPPSIFTVLIPGIYYMPAATIESFQVKALGSVIYKNIKGKEQYVPEGFNVNMVLQPLVPSSQGVTYAGARSTIEPGIVDSVQAITTEFDEALLGDVNAAKDDADQNASQAATDAVYGGGQTP